MEKRVVNKKIMNATPLTYNNIKFKSKLEVMCYKTLEESGLIPQYECKTYVLFEGFNPHIPFYTKNKFKKKNKNILVISANTVIDIRKVDSWEYTPDFYFEYNNYIVHIEVKGFHNDVSIYKAKLFRKELEDLQNKDTSHIYEFWEIHTKKQLLECIEHVKKDAVDNTKVL